MAACCDATKRSDGDPRVNSWRVFLAKDATEACSPSACSTQRRPTSWLIVPFSREGGVRPVCQDCAYSASASSHVFVITVRADPSTTNGLPRISKKHYLYNSQNKQSQKTNSKFVLLGQLIILILTTTTTSVNTPSSIVTAFRRKAQYAANGATVWFRNDLAKVLVHCKISQMLCISWWRNSSN